jgi:hypothetical protein
MGRNVQDEQILNTGGRHDRMIATLRELEMEVCAIVAQHHAVKSVVICESLEQRQAKTKSVQAFRSR